MTAGAAAGAAAGAPVEYINAGWALNNIGTSTVVP